MSRSLFSSFKLLRRSSHLLPSLCASSSTCLSTPSFARRQLTSAALEESDSLLLNILKAEEERQRDSIVLIPSENYTSRAVLQCLGSLAHNANSPGYRSDHVSRFCSQSAQFTDEIEELCRSRALAAYGLDPEQWGVNVQSYSGSPVNFVVYTALLEPRDRIMSLDLPHGGHLSHGYQIPSKKISAVSLYWEALPYRLDETTARVDYDQLERNSAIYRPKLIVSGGSAYSRFWDFERIRKICDDIGAIMLFDMAHISGLVAGGAHPSPFDYADVVTTTTHKSLRGPRAAMLFYRKGVKSVDKKGKKTMYDFEEKINKSMYPGLQDGACNHTIAALATTLLQAQSSEFKDYQERVVQNSQAMVKTLIELGYDIVSGGTDNHLALINLRARKVGGAQVERVCELANITLNKNTVPGDKSALTPGGIRIGAPAMTTRGLDEADFDQIARFIDEAVQISQKVQQDTGSKKLKDFEKSLQSGVAESEIQDLKSRVSEFAGQFALTGVDYV